MNEAEYMRKQGLLFTEKEYKKCLFLLIGFLVFSGLVGITGIITALVTNNSNVVIAGIIIAAVGFALMLLSGVFAFKNAGKIQLYRQYKKHPEDFEKEIEKNY